MDLLAILGVILLVLWRAPVWGQRVLAFLRDWDDYRGDRR
jgi:hypothetical protein